MRITGGAVAKRAIDIVVGSLLALLALPLILVLAVGVSLTLRSNPFFVQRRVGRGGRLIPVVKLRTLPTAVSQCATKYELRDVAIAPFTQMLRRLHLDELPQLFLVPLGYLSLVGPRPEMVTLHEEGDPRFAAGRTLVRPGCTGLWQVSEAASRLIWETPEYDLHYVQHHSVALDAWIMWRTVLTMTGLGAPIAPAAIPTRRRASVVAASADPLVAAT